MEFLSELRKIQSRVGVDEPSRLQMQDALRSAAETTETPNDTMLRLFNGALEVPMIKVGCDIGLFKMLVASPTPLTTAEIAKRAATQARADPALLGRVLRYLAATRFIAETGQDQFTANPITRSLADASVEGSLNYVFALALPAHLAVPEFLQKTSFQTPPGNRSAWQQSVQTDLDFFPYIQQRPEQLSYFQSLMKVPRSGSWLDVVSFAAAATAAVGGEGEAGEAKVRSNRALFVDIGGNTGHQSQRLRAKYPSLPGRIIVQDLPESIEAAPPVEGVEFMVYDFFTPQPVHGARFYYLRTVLHDWDEAHALQILKNTAAAMGADSQLLIDEMALPNTDVHWWSACLDMHMYTMFNTLERTVDQWRDLLAKAGLKLVDVRTYAPVMRNSILVVERS